MCVYIHTAANVVMGLLNRFLEYYNSSSTARHRTTAAHELCNKLVTKLACHVNTLARRAGLDRLRSAIARARGGGGGGGGGKFGGGAGGGPGGGPWMGGLFAAAAVFLVVNFFAADPDVEL